MCTFHLGQISNLSIVLIMLAQYYEEQELLTDTEIVDYCSLLSTLDEELYWGKEFRLFEKHLNKWIQDAKEDENYEFLEIAKRIETELNRGYINKIIELKF